MLRNRETFRHHREDVYPEGGVCSGIVRHLVITECISGRRRMLRRIKHVVLSEPIPLFFFFAPSNYSSPQNVTIDFGLSQ